MSRASLFKSLMDPEIRLYPERFVRFIYPWGRGELSGFVGPRGWQDEELRLLGEHVRGQLLSLKRGEDLSVYQRAVVSGRGIGKSALCSWIGHWMMSCVPGGTVIATANTESQLRSRTFAEVGRWISLGLNCDWFEKSGLSVRPVKWYRDKLEKDMGLNSKYYYFDGQPWSKENPDGFAGAHNTHGLGLIFDEASGIDGKIYHVSEGFFTELSPFRFWMCFSNGRRNEGPFYDSFHKHRKYWSTKRINSLDVEGSDHARFRQIIEKYGEDSDQAAVEVYGGFASWGSDSFISRGLVEGAVGRKVDKDVYAPLLMGVDVARHGPDSTIVCFRQGRDASGIMWREINKKDSMEVANEVGRLINEYHPDGVFVDGIGPGTGVIDRLKELGFKVMEVLGSSGSERPRSHGNLRMDMWQKMKDWLGTGSLPDDEKLVDDLTGPKQVFMGQSDKMLIESKKAMKSRGVASPDRADALSLTFARNVVSEAVRRRTRVGLRRNVPPESTDYDPFDY